MGISKNMRIRWIANYPNPVSAPLIDFTARLKSLHFSGSSLIPDSLVALVLSIVIILLGIFWLYGIVINIQRRLWDYAMGAKGEMKGKSIIEKVPYTITSGIFLLISIPFFIVCIPYYFIGIFGGMLTD
jgi:hypothetical protein